jgi:metallophosphoesterase superfamily enzyme
MLTVISDLHLGAIRSSGTTPTTQWALRQHLLQEFAGLLPVEGDLLINGDLADTGNIAISDVLKTYEILSDWLEAHPSSKLYNSAGNHDKNKTSNVLSSFQFLGKLLSRNFPERYVHIEQPTMTPYGYVIPHLVNQDVFDAALAATPKCEYVFLHANYDNFFAKQADQSLNVSKEQAAALPCKTVIFGHEHHARRLGKVLIPGNQLATSVSDWLSAGDKYKVVIRGGFGVHFEATALRDQEFVEMSWRDLQPTGHKFIRVNGSATQEEAHEVVNAIAAFRRTSEAFVITNAVQIESVEGLSADFESTLEAAKGFDVIKCLLDTLDAEERVVVEGLL